MTSTQMENQFCKELPKSLTQLSTYIYSEDMI